MDYQLRISDVARARRALRAAGYAVRTDPRGVLIITVPLDVARAILAGAGVQVLQEWPPAPRAPVLMLRGPGAADD